MIAKQETGAFVSFSKKLSSGDGLCYVTKYWYMKIELCPLAFNLNFR